MPGGRIPGFVLQVMMGSIGLFDLHTLLGLVQLPCTVLYVGIPKGRVSIMSWSVIRSRRGLINLSELNNQWFLSSSQSGWSQLKSPTKHVVSGCIFALVSRYVLSTSVDRLLVQSLYMLNMEQKPKLPLRCIRSCFQMKLWRADRAGGRQA